MNCDTCFIFLNHIICSTSYLVYFTCEIKRLLVNFSQNGKWLFYWNVDKRHLPHRRQHSGPNSQARNIYHCQLLLKSSNILFSLSLPTFNHSLWGRESGNNNCQFIEAWWNISMSSAACTGDFGSTGFKSCQGRVIFHHTFECELFCFLNCAFYKHSTRGPFHKR